MVGCAKPRQFARERRSEATEPKYRPNGPYCELSAFDVETGDKRKSTDQSRTRGGLYLKPKKRGAHFNDSGVLFLPKALSTNALKTATRVLRAHQEKQDPDEHKICWEGTESKKYTQHSWRATFRLLLRNAGCPEHFIDLAGGWASKHGAGAEYGHQTGVCPEEILFKFSAIIGGWRVHYDDMVMKTSALLCKTAELEQQRAFLITQLQQKEEQKKNQPQLQLQSHADPPNSRPAPLELQIELSSLATQTTRIETQLNRDFPLAVSLLREIAATTARLSSEVAHLRTAPPPVAPTPPPSDHDSREMREMRVAISNNTAQVARLVASCSKVSTDVTSVLEHKDADLRALTAQIADMRVGSVSPPYAGSPSVPYTPNAHAAGYWSAVTDNRPSPFTDNRPCQWS